MPALVLFGRRSRVGSDDFFCPALIQLMFQLPFVVVSVLYVSTYRSCSTMQLHNMSGFGFWYILLAIPIYGFMMFMNVLELHVSSQGTIISHENRILMKPLIVAHFAWAVAMLAVGTTGLVIYSLGDICYPDGNFVLIVALGFLSNVLGMNIFACLVIGGTPVHKRRASFEAPSPDDPENHTLLYGRSDPSLPNSDLYIPHQEQWERNCHRCCACVRCFTCNLFGGQGTQTDAMSVVASVFARFFYGSPDLVFSDIIAGFVLLGAVQFHEKHHATIGEIRAAQTGDGVTVLTFDDDDAPPKDAALVEAVHDLAHFSKYAIGIYGWMLYIWSHPWKGPVQLLFSCVKRARSYIHGDNCLHLHQSALQLETGVHPSDIIYASFHNNVCKPAFCIVLDHAKRQVVIAIRGTLSLEDCLTDAIAYGVSLDDVATRYQCDGRGAYAHQGMLQCAVWLMDEIASLNVLNMLFDPATPPLHHRHVNESVPGAYHDYGLVVTGHSLGAGAATLLALMLRPKYPALSCLAFSPPGCLVSPALAESMKAFVTSVVLGKDIIARASLLSFQDLRDQVLSLIGRSKVNKAAIMRQALSWRHPDELLHASEADVAHTVYTTQLTNYRTMLQRIQSREPIHEMWMPGRIIHLQRRVHSTKRGFCMCCRPGTGILCTDRTHYDYVWSDQRQFLTIHVGRTMLDDHFPDKVHAVLQDVKAIQALATSEDAKG
ncbi:Aste57867_11008 [Aphanomyces stellatus]|uniref:sn-1-specific diacylglycerol lipase n=1 Tax=Aphanomyces stellatus TaxID=120398 RepID=A0A485KT00_9STRA|nr:hypothetical protein As57867_010967 [Aphanomyces stellatus]VFT87876.1 Aste57867_11008 [Aphanomyces stellatus]